MVSGLIGVPAGAWLGTWLIKRFPRAHPVLCGVGLLVSAPAMTLAIVLTQGYFYAPFALMFVGELALNLNWAIVADMSLVRHRLPVPFLMGIRGFFFFFFNL